MTSHRSGKLKYALIVISTTAVLAVALLQFNVVDGMSPHRRSIAEIHMLSIALDWYKSDHGSYPSDPLSTEQLMPNLTYDPASYIRASQFLFRALSEEPSHGTDGKLFLDRKSYFEFPSRMLRTGETGGTYIVDMAGNSYGYSTFKRLHPDNSEGNNLEYDLWSTGGGKGVKDKSKWVKNW